MQAMASSAAIAIDNAQLYARNRRLAIEQERHRLARELHDSVTQALYSISLAAETSCKILGETDTDSRALEPIKHIQSLSQMTLVEMREQLTGMHSSVMGEKGLVEALAQHCDMLRGQYGLAIIIMAGPEPVLSGQRRNALFYIAKEALWNVVKHSEATRVDIVLAHEGGQLACQIEDNGIGFNPLLGSGEDNLGLNHMDERARQLGGSFEMHSSPGQGTRVTARIPIDQSSRNGNGSG